MYRACKVKVTIRVGHPNLNTNSLLKKKVDWHEEIKDNTLRKNMHKLNFQLVQQVQE